MSGGRLHAPCHGDEPTADGYRNILRYWDKDLSKATRCQPQISTVTGLGSNLGLHGERAVTTAWALRWRLIIVN
jgi:hypothetical protein